MNKAHETPYGSSVISGITGDGKMPKETAGCITSIKDDGLPGLPKLPKGLAWRQVPGAGPGVMTSDLSDEVRDERDQQLTELVRRLQLQHRWFKIDRSGSFAYLQPDHAPCVHIELKIDRNPAWTDEPLVMQIRFYHPNDMTFSKSIFPSRTISVDEAEKLIGLVIAGATYSGARFPKST